MQRNPPIATWLFDYRREWWRVDILAGVTAAAVVIPKVMAVRGNDTWRSDALEPYDLASDKGVVKAVAKPACSSQTSFPRTPDPVRGRRDGDGS